MQNENSKPQWYPKVTKADAALEVAGVEKVSKRREILRAMGLSAPLLAAGVILAVAQPPASSNQVASALITNTQSAVSSASSAQQSALTTSSASTLNGQKPSISGVASGNDGEDD